VLRGLGQWVSFTWSVGITTEATEFTEKKQPFWFGVLGVLGG
jgi:hypothetical protein